MIRLALALPLALLASITTPALAQVPPAPAASATTQLERISIRDEGGTGPAVILIPGLASPREVYAPFVPTLRARHRVFTVQVNGFGGDDPRANVKAGMLDGIVAELDGFVRERQLGRVAVVGHSMGGLAGMMLAARRPQSVGRLMVVDALPFFGSLFDVSATPEALAPQAARMRDATAADHGKPTPEVTTDPGGIWSMTPAGRIQVARWSRAADRRAVATGLYEAMTTHVGPQLGKVTARPFTVLYAAGAGPRAEEIWQQAYRGSPATLTGIPASYHFIMLDQPQAFAAELERFLG